MAYQFTTVDPQCTLQEWNTLIRIWNLELEACVKTHTVSGTQQTYLPIAAIHRFASYTTIAYVIHLGIRFGQYYLDEPGKFVNSIYAHARKLFTYIIYAGLDMNYLMHILRRDMWDVNLPITITVPLVTSDTNGDQNAEEALEARRIGDLVRTPFHKHNLVAARPPAPLPTMAQPLTILNTSSHSLQLMQIQSYIIENTVTSKFNGHGIEFIPRSAIYALTTKTNIEAVVNQDPDLKTIYFPAHSKAFFSNRVFNEAKRMFIMVMTLRLGMDFLRIALRQSHSGDNHLPLSYAFRIHDENNVFWDDGDVVRFLDAQEMVCAPTFRARQFGQKAAFRSSLPIVQADKMEGPGDEVVWRVRFHQDSFIGGGWGQDMEQTWFTVKMFESENEAFEDIMWARGMFGFTCEYVYYLEVTWKEDNDQKLCAAG
ncbi:hypothetical protein Ptr902_04749 [Pyrenophora tritici-repentis]|nr:hypothetical protein Ptr902_04749 [Pyrenophora tritici-repentis]